MSQDPLLNPLNARRQLGFLGTFDKKFNKLKEETSRLKLACRDPQTQGGQLAASEIERVVRGLVGAGPVYNVDTITKWAKDFLPPMVAIRNAETPPSPTDLEWLTGEIVLLERLHGEAVGRAKQFLTAEQDSSAPEPPPSSPPESIKPTPPESEDLKIMSMGWDFENPTGEDDEKEARPSTKAQGPSRTGAPLSALVVVEDKTLRKSISSALINGDFQVQDVQGAFAAIQLAQEESPDIIIIDFEDKSPGGKTLSKNLARNPLTDFIPVLQIQRKDHPLQNGAVNKPINPEELVATAKQLSGHEPTSEDKETGLRDLNLEELTEFVYSEINAGVIGAATGPHIEKSFPVLHKGPLIAAIWAVIARLRRVAAEGSKGNIRFLPTTHGPIGMMALDEAERVLDPSSHELVNEMDIASLNGLNAIVADDDPDIRIVLEKVLKVAGMKVSLAANGIEAMASIQDAPPDIVITDILMPQMDGWELATRLKWDFALKHIPIIMLSWKEDFLQRVRELNVDANGYMLKEMDRQQILSRVAGVLKPRFILERRLSEEGEITGRIERVGVMGILQAAMTMRPNCRITIRENWNYFEVDILDGSLVSVNRTGTDGSFASGIPALERLLGVSSGRFTIVHRVEISRHQFQNGGMAMIRQATRRLNDLNSQVVGGKLINIRELKLIHDVVEVYSKVIPTRFKETVSRIADGESPRSIILSGSISSESLETLLLDLIRMGAVKEIACIEEASRQHDMPNTITTSALISVASKQSRTSQVENSTQSKNTLTVDLSDDDIEEITKSPSQDLLTFASNKNVMSNSRIRIWQILTVFFFLAFGTVTFILLKTSPRLADQSPFPNLDESMATIQDTRKPIQESTPPSVPIESDFTTPPDENDDNANSENAEEQHKTDNPQSSSEQPDTKKTAGGADQTKTPETALLFITLPPEAPDQIRVSIDGRLRGKVPIRLRLGPGSHEIVYSLDGNRVTRTIDIQAGDKKKINAKIPK